MEALSDIIQTVSKSTGVQLGFAFRFVQCNLKQTLDLSLTRMTDLVVSSPGCTSLLVDFGSFVHHNNKKTLKHGDNCFKIHKTCAPPANSRESGFCCGCTDSHYWCFYWQLEALACSRMKSNITNARDSFIRFPNTEKRVENTTRGGVFLTKFEVF